MAVYNQLISTHPDDFRGYLAKACIFSDLITNHGVLIPFCGWCTIQFLPFSVAMDCKVTLIVISQNWGEKIFKNTDLVV